MKNATLIFRILLGFIYLVFGLDYFLHFIPYQPHHTGRVAAFKDALLGAGYFYPMLKSIQIIGGISLLTNLYAPFFAAPIHLCLLPGWQYSKCSIALDRLIVSKLIFFS
jgi:DoxX.